MRIIAGQFRGKKLKSPPSADIRPTIDRVRQSIFNILSSNFSHDFAGKNVLDLFAGTGAMGIEAMSRGAEFVCFVDSKVEARSLIRFHIEDFGIAGKAKLLKRDACNLGKMDRFEKFNLIFIDPPYGNNLGEKALKNALENEWVAEGAIIVLEEKAGLEIEFPKSLELFDKRKYGNSEIYFLRG